ncbi:peptidoglycan DD-metalloendopeptidase family protein [Corynebacterium glyciniphilum]|uniref:peptidoglycan DD-metalloendopeptidase family protein n=1 Tax=Corynebacterium glyciniphilum TaxID=1404244 RepID=UPI0021B49F07|nr:peptidoglycan DD-metalloendopeptidase family protein [Corynebacterium glyciniphilum]
MAVTFPETVLGNRRDAPAECRAVLADILRVLNLPAARGSHNSFTGGCAQIPPGTGQASTPRDSAAPPATLAPSRCRCSDVDGRVVHIFGIAPTYALQTGENEAMTGMTGTHRQRRPRLFTAWLGVMLAVSSLTPAGAQTERHHVRPVPGQVVRPADIPTENWLRGHRGVDLHALPGDAVAASAGGTVHFAGVVAGNPVVSINHSPALRTTYEPVIASVSAGDHVSSGEVIGVLADAGSLPETARREDGLSWGARTGDGYERYIDPMSLLAPVVVRLWS